MAATATGRVALFSIHPKYAEAILAGTKSVEFRRTPLADDVTHVVVYATAPMKMVVGIFEVDGVEALSPSSAWRKFGDVGAIDQASFKTYYAGASTAHVIKVGRAHRIASPLPLAEIDPALRPPQSFQYLSADVVGALKRQRHSARGARKRGMAIPRLLRNGSEAATLA